MDNRRQIASEVLGGPLTKEEVAQDYVRRSFDLYEFTLPSGLVATLIIPSCLEDQDRAMLQSILDLVPGYAAKGRL